MDAKNITIKKITSSIILTIILTFCLGITTFSLIYSMISVDNNLFHTGNIKINLNDGKPIIKEKDFLFEPGMTVKKEFFIENQSTWDVYYKLYLDNIQGDLADFLEITIKDGDKILYSDKASEITIENVGAAYDRLRIHERRNLDVYFHLPEDAWNNCQNMILAFQLCADAVQTKNNPNQLFD